MTHASGHGSYGGYGSNGGSGFTKILTGLFLMSVGGLFLMELMGQNDFLYIPIEYLQYGAAVGCILGGAHIIYKTIFKHRIILG